MRATSLAVLLLMGIVCGCEKPAASPPQQATPQPPPTTSWTPLSPDVRDLARPVQPAPQPAQPAPQPAQPVMQPAQPPQPAAPATEQVKAQKGVGLAGRSLDPHEGLIVTPAKAYFTVRERIIFEDQIPKSVQLYKATNDKVPQTFEDFKAQILDPAQIRLPELPPGQRYVWDAKAEQLNVERPRQ